MTIERDTEINTETLWTSLLGATVHWIDVKGVKTRVIEAGDGPPLLLLHGLSGHSESFAKNIVPLSAECRTMAVDMVGHGFTDKPPIDYDMDALVGHISDLIDSECGGKASIMGQSLGGWVACWLAIRHPEKVDRLILDVSAALRVIADDATFATYQANARNRTNDALDELTWDSVRKRVEWLVHDPADITDELVEIRMRIFGQPEAQRSLKAVTENLTLRDFEKLSLRPEQLRQITQRTFVVWSRFNVSTQWEEAEAASKIMPAADFHLIEGPASHWPQWEQPEEFNRVVLDWLRTTS